MELPVLQEKYAGRKLVIASMHGKERVIGPLLQKHLGVDIIVPHKFNSDAFGTFTRDVPRAGSQLDAARAKLLHCMQQSGCDLGVSSEGTFGPHPIIPFLQSNGELVLLIDKKHGDEITGYHSTPQTNAASAYVRSVEEARQFAEQIGFPEHGIIVRKWPWFPWGIHKDVESYDELFSLVRRMLRWPFVRRVFLETDMRAHKNPTRMKAIEQATRNLIDSCVQRVRDEGLEPPTH